MRFFLSQLTEVWVSFLGALIRFWDNRFQKKECAYCEYFKTEIEKLRVDMVPRGLYNPGLGHHQYVNGPQITQEEPTPEPVRGNTNWARKQRDLEKKYSAPNNPVPAITVDQALTDLEKEFTI